MVPEPEARTHFSLLSVAPDMSFDNTPLREVLDFWNNLVKFEFVLANLDPEEFGTVTFRSSGARVQDALRDILSLDHLVYSVDEDGRVVISRDMATK